MGAKRKAQGARRSVFSDIQPRECGLTSRGVWIAHKTYFPVLHTTCSLLHSRSLCRQATGGGLRDDTRNGRVADYYSL